jgi:hypothetical protein
LKIVIAPIRDDEASPGPGPDAEGTAGTDDEAREAEDEEEEDVGEDVDELEDDGEFVWFPLGLWIDGGWFCR